MKILVTGAAGFIGSHLIEELVVAGHEVVGLDGFIDGLYPNSQKRENWSRVVSKCGKLPLQELDLRKPIDPRVLDGVDVVYHLAAMPGLELSWREIDLYVDCNIKGTMNLLVAAEHSKIKKFLHISTSSVYGKEITDEAQSITNPISPYGITKLAAESLVKTFCGSSGMDYSIFRLFSVYGPGQRSDMGFYIFIEKILKNQTINIFGNGKQSRANTFVADVSKILVLALEKASNQQIYNICGPQEANVLEVISMISQLIGKDAKLEFNSERRGDQSKTTNVGARAGELLGFIPNTTLIKGLEQQIDWQSSRMR